MTIDEVVKQVHAMLSAAADESEAREAILEADLSATANIMRGDIIASVSAMEWPDEIPG
jgi:hypothetical protein